ncbi:pantetheine-phosphate adenylyltransferase [Lentilactobacillus sp. Marseille-Q4993]|uniref:pantetheine-phosphate adenylyltransferase n=1 Tax=Lentilactobacillus sp. Marseille-Q4993 TaxID=3039492 RepID=UPI0024BD20CA|nr:pantetheine-phosphate adenylyltransferase [Lentilactobacillus sp. Marseille-Q4993]
MTTALYAGSFDPITNGHVNVIERASKLFTKVVVAISINTSKKSFFTREERVDMAKQALAHLTNVEVIESEKLTVRLANQIGATVLVRGVRGALDIDSEMAISDLNESMDATIQTVFLPTSAEFRALSSSMIKEIAKFHGDVSKFVPTAVKTALVNKNR